MTEALRQWGGEAETPLVKLYVSGKLGAGDAAIRRLRAGIRLAADYRHSLFVQRTTTVYDAMPRGGKSFFSTESRLFSRQSAADRYLTAMRFLGKYQVYATHFIRDEENVHRFISKYRVLNADCLLTYAAVYKALLTMLDRLAAFYEREDAAKVCR